MLHHYDWSESSVIVEAFTRAHGRVALVAKGAKRPSSNFRPVLLPLQPLLLSWGGDSEIRTLKAAEWGGGLVMPRGDALLSGYYANELLLRLLAREDPHPRLFDTYAALVHALAAGNAEPLAAAALRAFELLLLRESGHLPAQGGLRAAHADDSAWLSGEAWQRLAASMDDEAPFSTTLAAVSGLPGEQRGSLRRQLRELLHYHCGVGTLRTRQLLLDAQRLMTP